MQIAKSNFTLAIMLLGITLLYLIIAYYWVHIVLRGNYSYYIIVLLVFLTVGTVIFYKAFCTFNISHIVLFGATMGYIASILAYMLVALSLPEGVDRFINTIQASSLSKTLVYVFLLSFLSCGWIVGIVINLIPYLLYDFKN